MLLGDPRGRRCRLLPVEEALGAGDQIGHQPCFPRAPSRRSGGQAVCFDQRGQQVEGQTVADLFGHPFGRGRVVQVAPGGHFGQEEMEANQGYQRVDIVGREAHPARYLGYRLYAHLGVVAGEPLADVVEKRADEQEIGALHPVGQGGGVGRGLEQVPVHGEPVVGVALGLVAYR
jgi:hypothetical protein